MCLIADRTSGELQEVHNTLARWGGWRLIRLRTLALKNLKGPTINALARVQSSSLSTKKYRESIYWCCLTNCKAGDSKADVAFQSSCEQGDRLWFMLKCVASKRRTRLLNKLNKSSAIHPGPGGSPVHVDQRRTAAACNITQWRRGPTGGKQHTEANTEHCSHRKELCTNAVATPARVTTHPQPPPPPSATLLEHHPHRGSGEGWAAPWDLTSFLWMAQLFGRRSKSWYKIRGLCQHTDASFVNTDKAGLLVEKIGGWGRL